ncbi:uncharacterized protein M6B38_271490 [Iris pallida]|uniref:Glutaredoxin domain-containing protein n=1 Tax=Iris pallida TaxID=29817 RepID=A0AAX6I756_IRIPA|nr:uncharacterized protein M6B38_271490 [Iris pallida]
MGCASSRDSIVPTSPLPPLPAVPKKSSSTTSFLSVVVIHHPPLHPGDSSHLVSLTSTTYNPIAMAAAAAKKSSSKSSSKEVILFTTSLRSIRRTYEDCRSLGSLLRALGVFVDERDVSMDASFRRHLQALLPHHPRPVALPQLFVGGRHLGGTEEVRQLHEDGRLEALLEGAPRVEDRRHVCGLCGGVRFLPCGECSGSRKVFEEETERIRRCPDCNENGLVRCPLCCSSTQ